MKFGSQLLIFVLIFCTQVHSQTMITNSSNIKAVAIRLKPGDDLKLQLEQFINTNKIKAACIISCVGSLDQAAIRYANQPNAKMLPGKFEIVSLTGTLGVSGVHLHISISDSTGKTIGGHLMQGSLVYTTAEIVIGILPQVEFERIVDSTYGYKELHIKSIKRRRS